MGREEGGGGGRCGCAAWVGRLGGGMYSTMLKFSVFKGDCLSDALIHLANATI